MGYSGNSRFAATLGLGLILLAVPLSAEAEERLRVRPGSAVPGQVVELSGPGVGANAARVTIGGRPAAIIERHGRRLSAVVPAIGPGKARIVVRRRGSRLSTRLRIGKGFNGSAKPKLDQARSRTVLIGPAGGSVAAGGRDGTQYLLSIPRGALYAPTAITLTPLARIGALPLPGKPVGVQFGPDGLALAQPATLTVTLRRRAPRSAVGFAYSGKGRGFSLAAAKRSGRTLTLRIEHFSGAGSATATIDSFLRLVAHYMIGKLTLEEVDEFLHQLQVVEKVFGPFCLTDATCEALFDRSVELLLHEAGGVQCERFAKPGQAILVLRSYLMIESNLRLLGNLNPSYPGEIAHMERVRRCITEQVVAAAEGPARDAPLALSALATGLTKADQANADVARDKEIWNAEWAVFLAGVAGQQGFVDLQARALSAFESGLAKVLADGRALCEQSFPEGSNLLAKGQKLADATLLLATEYFEAVAECKPRIFVTPAGATVEVDKTQAFSARSNDGDLSFDWSSSAGSIDASGLFTAPSTPGAVTVTAASRSRPALTGSTTVTVVCPAEQVQFEGECRTISVTVAPQNAVVGPGETKQFTATVHNTANQGVTWSASAGTISQAGLFTAPAQPGSYSITAKSKEDATKLGTAAVTVAQPGVNVTARASEHNLSSRAFAGAASGQNCPKPERDVDVVLNSRQGGPSPLGIWESNFVVSGSEAPEIGCNASLADAATDQVSSTTHDVESTDGDLTFTYSASDLHGIEMHRTGTQLDNEIGSSIYGLFAVAFTVAAEPVTLSCSTTLSGDSRAGNPTETDPSETLFTLQVRDAGSGQLLLGLEDTTAATEITLPPGKYSLVVENKTSPIRSNTTEEVLFTFGADAECHDV